MEPAGYAPARWTSQKLAMTTPAAIILMFLRRIVPLAAMLVSTFGIAQLSPLPPPLAPLPASLSGRWTITASGRPASDIVTMSFDGQGQTGPVKGRVSLRGLDCGSLDEPLSGSWDGVDLRLETAQRPEVGAPRADGNCGTARATFVLRRKPGDTRFEGEARVDGLGSVATV